MAVTNPITVRNERIRDLFPVVLVLRSFSICPAIYDVNNGIEMCAGHMKKAIPGRG